MGSSINASLQPRQRRIGRHRPVKVPAARGVDAKRLQRLRKLRTPDVGGRRAYAQPLRHRRGGPDDGRIVAAALKAGVAGGTSEGLGGELVATNPRHTFLEEVRDQELLSKLVAAGATVLPEGTPVVSTTSAPQAAFRVEGGVVKPSRASLQRTTLRGKSVAAIAVASQE